MPDFTARRSDFRALHQNGCFVIPNPWDIGSARYLEHLGFKALATTSAGFAFTRALPDGGVIALFVGQMEPINARERVQGVLEAVEAGPVIEVQPNEWRGSYGLQGGEEGKRQGLALAHELLGGHVTLARHDEADAVLIAWWGFRHLLTQSR